MLIGCRRSLVDFYLQDDSDDEQHPHTAHNTAVVGKECLSAAPGPDVEFFNAVIVVVVGGVIGQVMLDAGTRGAGVTAAKWYAVHQEFSFYVTEEATEGRREREIR